MKMTVNKSRNDFVILKEVLYRKRRGAKYRPQVGTITVTSENRFQVRIANLPKTIEPFVGILKGSDFRTNGMGRDLAGGYIVVERIG